MNKFEEFIEAIQSGATGLSKEIFAEYEQQASDDVRAFLKNSKLDLHRWTILLQEGKLTKEDFSDLVKAKKELMEIRSLRTAGISMIKLDRFKDGLMKLIINSAFNLFL